MAEAVIASGDAWRVFRRLVETQGGDVSFVDHPEKLPKAPIIRELLASRSGYLGEVDARIVGETSVMLGAGRTKKEDPIDHAVGIVVHKKVGDYIEVGAPLFTIHANRTATMEEAMRSLMGAVAWSDEPVPPLPLFYGVVKSTDIAPVDL
jgi:pyrimidine-nucleoside phosphorylase